MRSKFLLYELFRIVLFEEIARKYRGKKKIWVSCTIRFRGVEWRSIGRRTSRPRQSEWRKGRRGEVEGIRGGRRRGADKAAWSIRSAPIVDHFEGSVFERNPRKWSFFSRGFCRASHNCDLRGTGAAAARWQWPSRPLETDNRTIWIPLSCSQKSRSDPYHTGRSHIVTSFGGSFISNSSPPPRS